MDFLIAMVYYIAAVLWHWGWSTTFAIWLALGGPPGVYQSFGRFFLVPMHLIMLHDKYMSLHRNTKFSLMAIACALPGLALNPAVNLIQLESALVFFWTRVGRSLGRFCIELLVVVLLCCYDPWFRGHTFHPVLISVLPVFAQGFVSGLGSWLIVFAKGLVLLRIPITIYKWVVDDAAFLLPELPAHATEELDLGVLPPIYGHWGWWGSIRVTWLMVRDGHPPGVAMIVVRMGMGLLWGVVTGVIDH